MTGGLPRPAPGNFWRRELIRSSRGAILSAETRAALPPLCRFGSLVPVFSHLFGRRTDDRSVDALYRRIVAQSRQPVFYTDFAVPDTLLGRFDMIVIHAFLVFRRLKREDARSEAFCQALFDHMFADVDMSLREMGVGDLSVGKKVKALAKGFYGRVVAYERALEAPADGALRDALLRNVYPPVEPPEDAVAALARYIRGQADALAGQPVASFLKGEAAFAPADNATACAPHRETAALTGAENTA
ncbi:MAG: ubiquinol-cytochrome C chaperone [Alphaproteobacteria bacterium]|jgi:cytochrome b pre-mRNA-processing protein 3|nr:ubiquinol-cytochrome C chaperone [Alphaproteobacteria bacterium]